MYFGRTLLRLFTSYFAAKRFLPLAVTYVRQSGLPSFHARVLVRRRYYSRWLTFQKSRRFTVIISLRRARERKQRPTSNNTARHCRFSTTISGACYRNARIGFPRTGTVARRHLLVNRQTVVNESRRKEPKRPIVYVFPSRLDRANGYWRARSVRIQTSRKALSKQSSIRSPYNKSVNRSVHRPNGAPFERRWFLNVRTLTKRRVLYYLSVRLVFVEHVERTSTLPRNDRALRNTRVHAGATISRDRYSPHARCKLGNRSTYPRERYTTP